MRVARRAAGPPIYPGSGITSMPAGPSQVDGTTLASVLRRVSPAMAKTYVPDSADTRKILIPVVAGVAGLLVGSALAVRCPVHELRFPL